MLSRISELREGISGQTDHPGVFITTSPEEPCFKGSYMKLSSLETQCGLGGCLQSGDGHLTKAGPLQNRNICLLLVSTLFLSLPWSFRPSCSYVFPLLWISC